MQKKSHYQFFTTTKDAVDAMLEAVANAESSIYLETYIFRPLPDSYKFAEKLKEKAKQGLEVKIIFDGFGVRDFDEKIIEEMKEAGADVVIFNPYKLSSFWRGIHQFFERNHRKVLIIDKNIGFIGGVNISGYEENWLDLQIKIVGPAVRMLLRTFSHSYLAGGGTLDKIKHLLYLPLTKESYLRILWHKPHPDNSVVKNFYLNWIRKSKKTLTLISPYFLPDEDILKELENAKKRGVKIDVLLPWESDYPSLTYAMRAYWELYAGVGMKLYLVKRMIHAKAVMVDDKVAFVGSSNFDSQTFYRSHESNLIFSNKDMIMDLKKIIKGWKKGAHLFRPLQWSKRSFKSKFLEFWAKILKPFL